MTNLTTIKYIKQLEKENELLREKVKLLLLTENQTITRMTQKIDKLMQDNDYLVRKITFAQLTR